MVVSWFSFQFQLGKRVALNVDLGLGIVSGSAKMLVLSMVEGVDDDTG